MTLMFGIKTLRSSWVCTLWREWEKSAPGDCVAGADYQKQFQKVIEDCLPQQIFSFSQIGMTFKHKLDSVMASHKEVYKDMQHKE